MQKYIEQKLSEILSHLDVKPNVMIIEMDNGYSIEIDGHDLSFLIGFRGEGLSALQDMLNRMVFSEYGDWAQIDIDINGYKVRKRERLQDIAKNFIDKVRFHGDAVELPPMRAFERKIIHTFVSDYPDMESESTGDGSDRRVVIKVKE
jgi:spoIIIJ-associated protein